MLRPMAWRGHESDQPLRVSGQGLVVYVLLGFLHPPPTDLNQARQPRR